MVHQKNASKIIKYNIYTLYEYILDDLIKSKSYLNLSETVLSKLNSKENNFTLDVLNLIINDLIIKTVFYNEYKIFLGSTLNKEKELILDTSSTNSLGATPLFLAANSTFWPCSSVPVKKKTLKPSNRLNLAITLQANVV